MSLAGFENHGGRTHLGPGERPLGKVLRGHGNTGESGFEGVVRDGVIGTYLHGPLLPKNAWFADWLIATCTGTRPEPARRRVGERGACGGSPSGRSGYWSISSPPPPPRDSSVTAPDTAQSEGPSATPAEPLEFRAATKRYAGATEPAVDALSLEVPAGDICVLVGPSGCGKTTAMRMVNRMIDITEGDILLGGRSVRDREPAGPAARHRLRHPAGRPLPAPHDRARTSRPSPSCSAGTARGIEARVDELLDLIGLDQDDAARATPPSSPAASASASAWPARSRSTRP